MLTMPAPFLLDTNAYYLFFQNPRYASYVNFLNTFRFNGMVSFYISELTSLEIHSVLGKYRRGASRQLQTCNRITIEKNAQVQCNSTWISPKRKK